jgi:hypothetical protein
LSAFMRKKIVQFPVLVVLLVGASVIGFSLLFLIAVGVLVGLLAEVANFNSRISTRELKEYKIFKRVDTDKSIPKAKKVFKLSQPANLRGKGMLTSTINEKRLSEV